jgi:competence protein ComEC
MNKQNAPLEMDYILEDKIDGVIYGQLDMIEEKEDYKILTLIDNTIKLDENLIINSKNNQIISNDENTTSQNNRNNGIDLNTFHSNKLKIYSSSNLPLKIGNILKISGEIIKFQKSSNPGQFNEYQYNKILKIDYKVNADNVVIMNRRYSRVRHSLYLIKNKMTNVYYSILPEQDASILSAMILGEKSLLDEEIKALYQQSGISHILAISGLHVSLIGLTIYKLLRKIRISLIPTTFISVIILICYGILTNFSVSTNRAVVMLIIFMIGDCIGRTYDLLSATAFGAFIILVQSPMQILNVGFLLSFLAILGIALVYPSLSSIFPSKSSMVESIKISFSIQCMTLPILLYFFYEFPIYSVLINILVIPLSSIIVLLALLAGLIGCFILPIAVCLIGGVHYLLEFYKFLCLMVLNLPNRTILMGRPSIWIIITYYIILSLFIIINRKEKRKKTIILLSLLMIILFKSENHTLSVTIMDVGQGDGIFMRTPSGTTYFIDGGSTDVSKVGQYRIEPFLKSSGVWNLDYVIITHTDNDHISGIKELIKSMDKKEDNKLIYEGEIVIRHLVLPHIQNKDESYIGLVNLANEKGIKVLYMKKGYTINDTEVTITCLHPDHAYKSSSRNAYSTVLSVNFGQFDMLLTGDLEDDGEELLLDLLEKDINFHSLTTDYDVLKVAHHGSRYSTSYDFLETVKPEYAVISCGRKNSYGHPHPELLSRLELIKCHIFITSDSGAITIETNGEVMNIKKYHN